jgi:hypothetical protein
MRTATPLTDTAALLTTICLPIICATGPAFGTLPPPTEQAKAQAAAGHGSTAPAIGGAAPDTSARG